MFALDKVRFAHNNVPMLNPAKTVIEICGGTKAVAEMADRTENRIRRWTYPKGKRGGTGGLIPSDVQGLLLAEARKRGIDLRPEHLIPNEAGSAS
jgi:hypothetical protein